MVERPGDGPPLSVVGPDVMEPLLQLEQGGVNAREMLIYPGHHGLMLAGKVHGDLLGG